MDLETDIKRETMQKIDSKSLKWFSYVFAIAMLAFVIITLMIVNIPAGHVGVVFDPLSGGVQPTEMQEGFNIKMPWVSITEYSIRTQEYTMSIADSEGQIGGDDSIDTLTNEGLSVKLDITVYYKTLPTTVSELHQKVGPTYKEILVRPTTRTSIRDVVAGYSAKEIYSSMREEIVENIQNSIESKLLGRGIIIESVQLRNVKLPAQLENSIETKLVAEQEKEAMIFKLEKEGIEAERKKVEAGGISGANKIIADSLTTKYLMWYWIESLDSHNSVMYVPISDGGMPLMYDVSDDETLFSNNEKQEIYYQGD